jgi:hypothetical protein
VFYRFEACRMVCRIAPPPGGFRYFRCQPSRTAPLPKSAFAPEQTPQGNYESQEAIVLLMSVSLSILDHRPIRSALVVLAATAITSILLWRIAFPQFHWSKFLDILTSRA